MAETRFHSYKILIQKIFIKVDKLKIKVPKSKNYIHTHYTNTPHVPLFSFVTFHSSQLWGINNLTPDV